MANDEDVTIKARIVEIQRLAGSFDNSRIFQGGAIALSVFHDTVGGAHPVAAAIDAALTKGDHERVKGCSSAVVTLFEQGALRSPRLEIAAEIEGDVLDVAQKQLQEAEKSRDAGIKQTRLAIAAFLAGAALEDALRRLCDAYKLAYAVNDSTIAKLQAVLYQPSKGIEKITKSENKQITAWGDTRNNADHGKFNDITIPEVTTMIIGTRAFIEKHLSA